MTHLSEVEHAGEVVQRGISGEIIARGVFGRFFPASLISLGSIVAFLLAIGAQTGPLLLVGLGIITAGLTTGFGLALTGLRRYLYPDAGVETRRSVLAGLCSPLYAAFVSLLTQGASLPEVAGLTVLTGAGVGLALYFPWLTRTRTPGDVADDESPDAGLRISSAKTM